MWCGVWVDLVGWAGVLVMVLVGVIGCLLCCFGFSALLRLLVPGWCRLLSLRWFWWLFGGRLGWAHWFCY